MLRNSSRKLKVAAVCTLIGLAGTAVGAWRYRARNNSMRTELLEDARRATVAFHAGELGRLAAAPTDLTTPAYAAVKERLHRLKIVDSRVRYVYLFRPRPETGKV